jgi:hypothetical protein
MKLRALLMSVALAATTVAAISEPAEAAVRPSPPRSVRAVGGNRSVRLTWQRPASNGGARITDYVIRRRAAGSTRWVTVVDGVSTARSVYVTGLQNGRQYYFRIRAKNRRGAGRLSAAVSAIPATVPSGPLNLQTVPGDRSVRLTWQPPASTGGAPITDYEIRRRAMGTTRWITVVDGVSTARSTTVGGLTNGQTYEFTIAARNRIGLGSFDTYVWSIPVTVPSAPRTLSAVAASGSVRLTWTAPTSNGGAPLFAYRVQFRAVGTAAWLNTGGAIDRSATVTGLANGRPYQFRVAAVSRIGVGVFSAPIAATPFGVPSPPGNVSGDVVGTTATITFDIPHDDGGKPIIGYDAECASDNGGSTRSATGPGSPLTVDSLTSAKTYRCQVTAETELGIGTAGRTLPFPVEAGLFAFLGPHADGTYSRWNPCRSTIDYQIDTRVGTAAELAQIATAVADVEARTGHDFHYAGPSPDGQSAPGVEMMLGYREAFGGWVIGLGGYSAYGEEIVSSYALVLAGMGPAQAHSTWLHEIGHAVGLGHVDDDAQIMYPVNLGLPGYGDGDREGLRLVGATMPCIAAAANARGRPTTITWVDEE